MSDINTYANETAIAGLSPINGDLVLNQDNNSLYLCTNADASGLASWKKFAHDGVEAAAFNRWGASFDSAGEELAIPQGTFNLGSGLFTFSLWFNADSLNDYNVLFRINSSTLSSCSSFIRSNGQIYLSNWTYNQLVSTGNTINTGAWNHLAYVKSTTGSSGTVTIYYNGSSVASGPVPNGSNFGSETGTSSIGRSYAANHWPFNGKIDEFAFWDTALSAPDIAKIYNGTAPNGKPTDLTLAASYDTDRTANLKGYWRMGDDSNDSPVDAGNITGVTDSSGNGNHATTVANSQPTFSALTSSETIYV